MTSLATFAVTNYVEYGWEAVKMFRRKPRRVVVELMPEELSLVLKAFIDWRNKLIEENMPLEDVDALILKLYSKLEAC